MEVGLCAERNMQGKLHLHWIVAAILGYTVFDSNIYDLCQKMK